MRLLLFLVLLITTQSSFAQSYLIKGRVFNQNDEPLQGASVFAQNTTLGTVSDADGRFSLGLPSGSHDLVITFTGMQAESKRVNAADAREEQVFKLNMKEKQMEEVAVVASNEVKDGWIKYGVFFIEEFIGESPNAKQTTILNPEVLKFYYSKRRDRLKVMADEDLLIENKGLGYRIKYTLDSFTHEYATKMSMSAGYPLFEEMPADSAQTADWMLAREMTYDGSILHLMRSIYDSTILEQGFQVQGVVRKNNRDAAVPLSDQYAFLNYQKDDSLQVVRIIPQQQRLSVLFNLEKPLPDYLKKYPGELKSAQFSVLEFTPSDTLTIEPSGYYFEQAGVAYKGYLGWSKIGDLLPYNYVLPGDMEEPSLQPAVSAIQ